MYNYKIIKKIIPQPLFKIINRFKHNFREALDYGIISNEKTFEKIYTNKIWGKNKNFPYYSGSGSHLDAIINPYVKKIKTFLKTLGKPVVIDYGCGDFNVGKNFINEVKTYYAYDVVDNLIKYNKKKFKFKNLHFKKKDITKDNIKAVDVIFVRQVLQHLSNRDIEKFLKIIRKKTRYLVVTEHFPNLKKININNNKIKGASLRFNSAVVLHKEPFSMKFLFKKEMLKVKAKPDKGYIITTLYKLNK